MGDATLFRLGIEAHRLRLAHSIDPYAALNASRIDPLPHQFEAVYAHLLSRPVVRALLAHDAGAGKTIMAGMLIKELKRRQGVRRILVVAPAGLTGQWRRELLTKFGEDFTIISREFMQDRHLDSLDVWRETDFAIVSIDYARQKRMRQALETVEWDLVVVDEAHKMAAYQRRPNASLEKTQNYELGEVLSRHTTHFLLMTATPHKGDPDNYRLLISLVDPQWGDATQYTDGGANPVVLRRTKEEMRKPDGQPLYPERLVEPIDYSLSQQEGDLLEAVQKFIRKRYERAKSANKQSAAFALVMLERRLASSPYALRESLKRMRNRLEERRRKGRIPAVDVDDGAWEEWEDLTEGERWARESRAESDAADLVPGKQIGAEMRQLDTLLAATEAINRQGSQQKIKALRDACDLWVGEQGQQLIIFTEFKDTLDYLLARLAEWGYTTTQIHGGMAQKERRKAEKAFWEGTARVLVATEAAGEGINLQCCHVMVNFDLPWNPCRLEQRMGRIHRYGQPAPAVFIFNLVATNSMEDEVKQALLNKMDQMRRDLGDKVFDVVGSVLWHEARGLREVLERVALGEKEAVEEAKRLIEAAGEAAKAAIQAERDITITAAPLDIADFRRKQATFHARRLSPEASERFFRQVVPLFGGGLKAFTVQVGNAEYPAFEVTLPPDLRRGGQRRLRLSFWPEACTDDETEEDAVLFIAPGHWLFDLLLERTIEHCTPALAQGCVFFDLQPEDASPYLVWFIKSHIRDGLDRRACDLLAAVKHRADQERVVPLPTEILDGFDLGEGCEVDAVVRQVKPMLQGQVEVSDQCVADVFLPELAAQRAQQQAAIARDWAYLKSGLQALMDHLSDEALTAYVEGNVEVGERLTDKSSEVQRRLEELESQMTRASHLLMVAPEVLGVALVAPAPVELVIEDPSAPSGVPMRRAPRVEAAAMRVAMQYEREQGRFPKDVHERESWDIESYDAEGVVQRYIEVKGRGPEDALVVSISTPERNAMRRLGDQHWLYIVRLGDGMMLRIQNPAKLKMRERKVWELRISDAMPLAEISAIDPGVPSEENPLS